MIALVTRRSVGRELGRHASRGATVIGLASERVGRINRDADRFSMIIPGRTDDRYR